MTLLSFLLAICKQERAKNDACIRSFKLVPSLTNRWGAVLIIALMATCAR